MARETDGEPRAVQLEATYDVVVVGAGAAGMMAACEAAQAGVRVLLLDGREKIGAKILVSGGGRCNVTNAQVEPANFHGGSRDFIGRVLRAFDRDATLRLFEKLQVPLKLEPTGKYFPVSDSARTVLEALRGAVRSAGAQLVTGCNVLAVVAPEGERSAWQLRTDLGEIQAGAVILCTGGLALPKTGSDGRGYGFAQHLGHTLVTTTPALTPLLSTEKTAAARRHTALSGLTLPVRLTLRAKPESKQVLGTYVHSFLFTHTGYSGPAALNLSRHVARDRWQHPQAEVYARFLPDVDLGQEGVFWQKWTRDQARKSVMNAVREVLPERLAAAVVSAAKVAPDTPVGRLSGEAALAVRRELLESPLPVGEVAGYVKAETTAGGISLDEMHPATMMSRLRPGLFFAGEICDVDGWLGGYNFQWAWSSGVVAGRAAARHIKQR